MDYVIMIPGKPTHWRRARVLATGNKPLFFESKEIVSEKATVQQYVMDVIDNPIIGPVEVSIEAVFACPRSDYRKREPIKRRHRMSRPDSDNLAKFYLDAMNGVAYIDDVQVVSLHVRKIAGAQDEPPHTQISIKKLE